MSKLQDEGNNQPQPPHGSELLSYRLAEFRRWLSDDAKCVVHPALCIVNGEATDGTKNAPVLLYGPPEPKNEHKFSSSASSSSGVGDSSSSGSGRCGMIDKEDDRALWDRTLGCQVRGAKDIKKGDVLMKMPRGSMITPEVVQSSDAGKAVRECCDVNGGGSRVDDEVDSSGRGGQNAWWDAFAGVAEALERHKAKIVHQSGTQLLVTILRERKKAEDILVKARREDGGAAEETKLVPRGKLSSRAPVLAFLIHQRFGRHPRAVTSCTPEDLLPEGCPTTFAPYVQTLPPTASLPFCWKRNELALLSGCFSGMNTLQDVAAQTLLLSSDLISLVKAGILHRFPDVFTPNILTWDTWVWAGASWMSRSFPVSCYLRQGESTEEMVRGAFPGLAGGVLEKTVAVWEDLGVMIPLLDMINHEAEAEQITWERPRSGGGSTADGHAGEGGSEESEEKDISIFPCALMHKRVKKGNQVYSNYGQMSNQNLILQYGFAQIGNPSDEIGFGWGLMDAVGRVPVPSGYEEYLKETTTFGAGDEDGKHDSNENGSGAANCCGGGDIDETLSRSVFESTDPNALASWWTADRLDLLRRETNGDEDLIKTLRDGKKLSAVAYTDGNYHPIFLAAAVVATMTASEVKRNVVAAKAVSLSSFSSVVRNRVKIKKGHQRILRQYLEFFYVRKLEKLLSNINAGLKDHFHGAEIWTRATDGGLQYRDAGRRGRGGRGRGGGRGGNSAADATAHDEVVGWQTFFDSYAYGTTMEVERRYYAMGADSCVLALYDGNLRAIQTSIEGTGEGEFTNILKQLEDLDFEISNEEEEEEEEEGKVGNDDDRKAEVPVAEIVPANTEKRKSNVVMVQTGGSGSLPQVKPDENNAGLNDNKIHGASNGNSGGSEQPREAEKNVKVEPRNKEGLINSQSATRDHHTSLVHNNSGGVPSPSSPKKQMEHGYGGRNNDGGNNRRRFRANRTRGSGGGQPPLRPPAIKLHIGNLSYTTLPNQLYDFFAKIYGSGNVLECHIPTERETGKSRGFGFVTMPELIALQALESDKKHEIEGRVLKVARSNTAGSGKSAQTPAVVASDRCSNCGYRPKYCLCQSPNVPGDLRMQHRHMMGRAADLERPGWGGCGVAGGGGGGGWNSARHSYCPSSLNRLGRSDSFLHRTHHDHDWEYDRGYDKGRRRSYSRSRSRSYSRDRDKNRGRDRRRRSHGSRRRSRSRSRYSASRSKSRSLSQSRTQSRSRSRSRSRSQSRSYDKGSPRKKYADAGHRSRGRSRSRSHSHSRSHSKGNCSVGGSEKKRSGKSRESESRSRSGSRSRSRGRRKRRRSYSGSRSV